MFHVAVNSYYTENGIVININSPKALETVVGHEVSHALEGLELYDSLKDAVTPVPRVRAIITAVWALWQNCTPASRGMKQTSFKHKRKPQPYG